MRRRTVSAILVVVALVMLAVPAFAQAPAPKVTIVGLIDQVTSFGKNYGDGNFTRDGDKEWYARTRFRPDIIFEVGRTKAVLGLELDLVYGQTGACGGGPTKNQTSTSLGCSGAHQGVTSDSGLNTDTTGVLEIKWAYTEFDLTGKDSLLPFIPVLTVARAGLQPFSTIANYRVTYANGDFAGASTKTTFTPDINLNLAFVVVENENSTSSRGTPGTVAQGVQVSTATGLGTGLTGKPARGHDYAYIVSPEITPFKGLDIKPLFSYFQADGTTASAARRSAVDRKLGGGQTNAAGTFGNADNVTNGSPAMHENRYTVGLDSRLRMGPFGLDPTVMYQWGDRDVLGISGSNPGLKHVSTDVSAWLFDVLGSFQLGPLLLEARAAYSTGNKARDNLSRSIRYYEPLDFDTGYWSTWGGIMALDDVDFGTGCNNAGICTNVGYDRYGLARLGARATYSITPALSVILVVSPMWTAEKVDTDTGVTATGRTIVSDKSFVKGDSRYLGTETSAGLGWRFAPNTSFDVWTSWLSTGKAQDATESQSGVLVKKEAKDAYAVSARVRLAF